MDKIKIGQPIKYTFEEKQRILSLMTEYLENTEYPTMPDFCVKNKVSKRRVYEWASGERENEDAKANYPLGEYFSELIEMMNNKQEAFIEKNAMQGNITPAFAIFKLKQRGFGWTDRQEVDVSGGLQLVKISKDEENALK